MNEQNAPALDAWICEECGYVYDPTEGDLEQNIRPGIPFGNLPDDWLCPVCNAVREKFRIFDSTL
jgi:rubredoxin